MDRRTFLAATIAAAVPSSAAPRGIDSSRVSAITDEIARTPAAAIQFAHEFGMKWLSLHDTPAEPGPGRVPYYSMEPAQLKQVMGDFKDAGIRLSELAGLRVDDVNPASREATVTGKGDKQRTVRFTYDTARALDRYSRERMKHPTARVSALWLGVRGGPMTASGIYQMIERRGREADVEVNPHKFRHSQVLSLSRNRQNRQRLI